MPSYNHNQSVVQILSPHSEGESHENKPNRKVRASKMRYLFLKPTLFVTLLEKNGEISTLERWLCPKIGEIHTTNID